MPQVDKVTFFPQVIWLITLLVVFYIFFLRNIFVGLCNTQTIRVQFYLTNFASVKVNQVQKAVKNFEIFSANCTVAYLNVLDNKENLTKALDTWFQTSLENEFIKADLLQELQSKKTEQYFEEKIFVETSF